LPLKVKISNSINRFILGMVKLPRKNTESARSRKDQQVDSFEQLVEQYTPMIHKIIHSLNIYQNQDEFYQTALIGLWEAHNGFNANKGSFTNYAYTFIKGKLQLELTKCTKYAARTMYPKEVYWETIEQENSPLLLEEELLQSYCHGLTEKETKWLLATYVHDLSVKEIAEREHVSLSAVKQWKMNTLKKLRHS
jgi:RNA polymerase sigma factor (sigma-70 family)